MERAISGQEQIDGLKAAVQVSPDNVPLRTLLGDAYVSVGKFEEAENEFTVALQKCPNDPKIMHSLAYASFQSGKYDKASVLVEDMVARGIATGKSRVLFARLLLNEGQIKKARLQYQLGVELDNAAADETLAEQLGITDEDNEDDLPVTQPKSAGRVRQPVMGDDHDDDEGNDSAPGVGLVDVIVSDIKFADVGGMTEVKEQIEMKIIHPLTHAETFKAYGQKVGGGILLYGPPGCGKTYLAKATAGEIDAKFISIGLHDVLDMWLGSSEKKLHEIFETARYHKPCVLFFDEVDALAASRSDMRQASGRHIINQFLNELDGVGTDNDGVLILAATNAPWHVDSAFRRPGRFDRILFVPPPDAPARAATLRILLRGKPMENVDFELIGKKTDKFSGADLKALIDQAVERKIADAMKTGKPMPITTKDLDNALKNVKPSTTDWFATARNYAVYSNEGGQYDDILKYLKIK